MVKTRAQLVLYGLTFIRFNRPTILLTMLQKSYIKKISPAAMKTLRKIVTDASVQAIIDNDQATMDQMSDIYSLVCSIDVSFNNKDLTD